MKILSLATTILLTFNMRAQTFVYHHFPDSSAIWNLNSHLVMSLCPPNGPTVDQYYSITFAGDTVINALTYHKLFTPYIQIIPSSCPPYPIGYKGALREDTLAKKVYYVPPSNSSEQLLYDWTMQVGDTVKGFLETYAMPVDTVYSIDSVLVGTTYRKRWNINPYYNICLIEGIGSTFGLIEASPGLTPDHPVFSLTCYIQNGQTLYPNTSTNCYLLTSVSSFNKNIHQVNIYPSPVTELLFIETNSIDQSKAELFEVNGKLVLSQIVSGKSTIDVSALNEGIYSIRIKFVDSVLNKKLVVVR